MNIQWAGMVFAFTAVSTIALGHVVVRRLHPIFGTRLGLPLIVLGISVLVGSGFVTRHILSGVLGIIGITTFWDGIEFFRQEKRVQKGQV